MKQQVCAGGFLVKNNKFLFGKRSSKKRWAPGEWDIMGGKSLKDEHPLYTLKRELYEEAGVIVINADLMKSVNIFDDSTGTFFMYHIYMITHWRNNPTNSSKEHTKLEWFTREKLNEISIAVPEYLNLIDDWLKT